MELTVTILCLLFAAGLTAGLVGSMLGVGGGIIIVPVLTLALKLPIQIAIGSSLVAIVANSCTAAGAYLKTRLVNIKLGLLLVTTTIPGAIVGALLMSWVDSPILGVLFAILLLYVSYSMIFRQPIFTEGITTRNAKPRDDDTSSCIFNHSDNLYYDLNQNQMVSYGISRIPLGMTSGFFAGILSSMLGIGGGIVKVPVMHSIMGVPIKVAIGTSNFMIALTTAAGALIYYHNGYVHASTVAPLILGVVVGALLGSSLAQKSQAMWLRRGFGILIFITAVSMFLRTANVI
jgi:uncharacterized membrane protein YfcA